jgi:hypothetical protein
MFHRAAATMVCVYIFGLPELSFMPPQKRVASQTHAFRPTQLHFVHQVSTVPHQSREVVGASPTILIFDEVSKPELLP